MVFKVLEVRQVLLVFGKQRGRDFFFSGHFLNETFDFYVSMSTWGKGYLSVTTFLVSCQSPVHEGFSTHAQVRCFPPCVDVFFLPPTCGANSRAQAVLNNGSKLCFQAKVLGFKAQLQPPATTLGHITQPVLLFP